MKICVIVSGDNIFFERVCEYFIHTGHHEIHAIPISTPKNKVEKVYYHSIGELKPKRFLYNLYKYFRIRRYINTVIKPDVLSSFYITQCGWLGAFTGVKPFILHIMGSDFLYPSKGEKIKLLLNNYTIKKACVIISESEFIKSETITIRKTDRNNFVIQYGVDLNLFQPCLDTKELKEKLNIKNEYVLISPRNSNPIYNQDIVIKAFSKVCKEKLDVILLMKVQNKNYEKKFADIAIKYGILNKIRFYEFVPIEKLPFYYNLAKIMISIPSSDSVSVSLQEAMACGVIPIVSDVTSTKEWVKHNINGFIIPFNDADILAETILDVIHSSNQEKIINYNFELVNKKSNFNLNMAELEKIYLNSCIHVK